MYSYPKILIISHNVLSKNSNNGKTLASIFKDWDKKQLAQIYFLPETPDADICSSNYRITDLDNIKAIWQTNPKCGGPIYKGQDIKEYKIHSVFNILYNIIKNNKSGIMYTFRDLVWKLNKWNTWELHKWINNFNPEIIFFVGGFNTFSYDFTQNMVNRKNIPLVTYYTDDYILPKKTIDPFWWYQNYRVRKRFFRFINISKKVFVIGDLMRHEYSKHFGGSYISLMHACNIQTFDPSPEKKDSQLTLSYIGNLGLERWKSLAIIGEEIKKLHNEGYNIKLNIYCAEKPHRKIMKSINMPPYCQFAGSLLESSQVGSVINNSDIVVHVESFKRKNKNITRLSISTKIFEYAVYGKCILAFGPDDIASIKLLKDNNAGIICRNKIDIYNKLKKIIITPSIINNYKESVRMLAITKLRQPNMKRILSEAIKDHRIE